ncbi:MAG: ABC transporter ATP-binding protein [Pseudomonadota bacterium]
MASIALTGVRKSFGETSVLKGVNLDIADGEFLTLVGPSGCGKSTLLRIVAGLEDASTGTVQIDGRDVTGVGPSARDLAMVFQSYALYPHLSVEENMMTPLRLRDLTLFERLPLLGMLSPKRRATLKAIRAAVRETAETLKIEPLLMRKPGQLSGGQRQRVALGRAMVRKPVAFLMDEPLSNLDAALRVHMRAELAELHRDLKATFIYVTHDQAEALTMSDRVAVMMGGEILQLAPPSTVYSDPVDLRVAEFIGSPKINTLPGALDGDGRATALGVTLRRQLQAPAQPITIGIRPEHLEATDAAGLGETISAVVTHKENLGSDVYLHGALDHAGAASGARIVARAKPEFAATLSIGDRAHFRLTPGAVMAFTQDNARLRFAAAAGDPAHAPSRALEEA